MDGRECVLAEVSYHGDRDVVYQPTDILIEIVVKNSPVPRIEDF